MGSSRPTTSYNADTTLKDGHGGQTPLVAKHWPKLFLQATVAKSLKLFLLLPGHGGQITFYMPAGRGGQTNTWAMENARGKMPPHALSALLTKHIRNKPRSH